MQPVHLEVSLSRIEKQCPSTAFAKDYRGYTAWADQSLSSPGGLAEKKRKEGGSDPSRASDPSQSLESCCMFWQESPKFPLRRLLYVLLSSGSAFPARFMHVLSVCTTDEIFEVPQICGSM